MLYYKDIQHPSSNQWVVFIHGAGGSSSIWYRQVKFFKEHFNVLLIDLRGHGRSKDVIKRYVKENYSFRKLTEDIIEVLDHLKIEKAHFIGVSLGTIIIRTLAELCPERVSSMVLCGAIVRLNFRSKLLVHVGNFVKRIVPYMWLYKLFAWIIMPGKKDRFSRSLFVREAKKLYQHEFLKWFKLTSEVNPLLRYFSEKKIAVPSHYVMGSEDYMFLPQVKRLVNSHKNASLYIIENCGHVCNIDAYQTFNKVAHQFIINQVLDSGDKMKIHAT